MAIVSVRIGTSGAAGRRKRPIASPGLRYSHTYRVLKPLSNGVAVPVIGHAIWVAVWEDGDALDAYERAGAFMPDAYALRLLPVRQYGTHRDFGTLADIRPGDDGSGPYAVITAGTMANPLNLPRFLRHSAAATRAIAASPSVLAIAPAMSGFNRFLSFTLWRDLTGMRAAVEGTGGSRGHRDAKAARAKKPFMGPDDTFIRLRPLASSGTWDGRDPLAGLF